MMHVPGQPARWAARLLAGPTAAIAALGLAACGTQVASTARTTAQTSARPASAAGPAAPHAPSGIDPGGPDVPAGGHAALCSAATAVTRLVVAPVSALPQSHVHPGAMPGGVTIASAAQARAVARALCALPAMPRGPVNCPNDTGSGYRLSFAAGRLAFPAVTVNTTGCTRVTGIGAVRTVAHSPAFWTVLRGTLGTHHAAGPGRP